MIFFSIEVRLFLPPRGMASKLKRPRSLFFSPPSGREVTGMTGIINRAQQVHLFLLLQTPLSAANSTCSLSHFTWHLHETLCFRSQPKYRVLRYQNLLRAPFKTQSQNMGPPPPFPLSSCASCSFT